MRILEFRPRRQDAAPPPGMVDLPALVTRYINTLKEDGIEEPLTELFTLGWILSELCLLANVPLPPELEFPERVGLDGPRPA